MNSLCQHSYSFTVFSFSANFGGIPHNSFHNLRGRVMVVYDQW